MPSFSPSGYLSSQGWSGPGSGLQPGSRAKPITVIKRKDLQGLGKERDESFAWWDDVFKTVAGKVGKTSNAEGSAGFQRTKTGIISPLPPPVSSSALNLDAIASAKQSAVKRQLYGRFMRGRPIAGTVEEKKEPEASTEPELPVVKKAKGKERANGKKGSKEERRAKRAAKAALAALSSTATPALSEAAARQATTADGEGAEVLQRRKKKRRREPDANEVISEDCPAVVDTGRKKKQKKKRA